MTQLNNALLSPNKPIGKLVLNLYGTKSVCHRFHQGLVDQLRRNVYRPGSVDQCMFIKPTTKGSMIIRIGIDDFLVSTPKQNEIDLFGQCFGKIYCPELMKPINVHWLVHYSIQYQYDPCITAQPHSQTIGQSCPYPSHRSIHPSTQAHGF